MMKRHSIVAAFAALIMVVTCVPIHASNHGYRPVYQFYSSFMKDHFLTASESEKEQLINNYYNGTETYKYQGVVGYVPSGSYRDGVPVYRFWNKKTTDHFYTASYSEKVQVEQDLENGLDDYVYEGIAFYLPEWGDTPVYRFYDVEEHNHFYTSDADLKDRLVSEYMSGSGSYRYEGVAWYWY